MKDKKTIIFAHERPAPNTARCSSCRNLVVTHDSPRHVWVYDETGSVLPQQSDKPAKTYAVARCKVDHIARIMDPHGPPPPLYPPNTPIRTCREVQLDECEGGRLYEPIH